MRGNVDLQRTERALLASDMRSAQVAAAFCPRHRQHDRNSAHSPPGPPQRACQHATGKLIYVASRATPRFLREYHQYTARAAAASSRIHNSGDGPPPPAITG